MDRRRFLQGVSLVAPGVLSTGRVSASEKDVRLADNPFKLGVASGDPLQDGFVIWTRLIAEPFDHYSMPQHPVPVSWEISTKSSFNSLAAKGTAIAHPANAHAVHVEVHNLKPDAEYFYRFRAAGHESPVGRTRTLPMVGHKTESVSFALASCQSRTDGQYAAYRDMVEQDPMFVLHVGDYIYENDWIGGPRRIPIKEAMTLDDYRALYAAYKLDAQLQAAHAQMPWYVIWDDHEVDNDWGGDYNQQGMPPEAFLQRKIAAFKAFYEHLPLRRASLPRGANLHLYKRAVIGDLAQLELLDCRQYRDGPACLDELPIRYHFRSACEESLDASRSMLGSEQKAWLSRGLGAHQCGWQLIAQTTSFERFDLIAGEDEGFIMDGWDGFAADRDAVVEMVSGKKLQNAVSLGGNIHAFYGGAVAGAHEDAVMSELVCTSITSGGGGETRYQLTNEQFSENPHARFFDNRYRGYLLCNVTRQELHSQCRTVRNIHDPESQVDTLATLTVLNGSPEVHVDSGL